MLRTYSVHYTRPGCIENHHTCMVHGNMTIPPPNTNRLIDYADKHKLPLIIGSDTNAQHKLWGNK